MRRQDFFNAIALLGLFIALGGTSYAVIKLPASSVGTRELKRNAVTGSKVRDGTIGKADLAPSAAGRRGPRGPQGPAGESGGSGNPAAPGAWQALPFNGAWTNYANGFPGGAYRKDQDGQVHLRGVVTKNGSTPVQSDVIARLPEGYRPSVYGAFAVVMGLPDGVGRVDVAPSGDVLWSVGPSTETDFTYLNDVSFWTD